MAGKFLIVDADSQVRSAVAAVARAASIEPVLAGTLAEALAALAHGTPDLALIADQLPDGAGATLLAPLAERHPETEAVLMISRAEPDQLVAAMRDGAVDFLRKPFTPKQLAQVLSRVMKNRAKRRQPADPVVGGTALIVDDEPLTLRILGNFLAEAGFAVFQARTLTEARATVESRLPDVVVSDIFLEAESGLDFLREVRHRWPFLPVVVVTSSTQSSILLEAMKAEAHSVLIKPLDKTEFQRVVSSARRLKLALEDRNRLQRAADAHAAGLAFLEGELSSLPTPVPAYVPPAGRAAEAFDSLPSGIVLFDRDRRIVELNPAACRLLGLARDTVLGVLLEDQPTVSRFQEAVLQTLATGQTFTSLETRIVVAGAERTFGFNAAPLVSPGHDGGALVYFQDITAKKRIEQQVRQTERLASVGMLAAGVTSEISTPLTVAQGHTDMLSRVAGDPERLARHVEKIQEALRQATGFAAKLLRMAKPPELEAKPTDLNEALGEVVKLLDRKLRLRSQQMDVALEAIGAEVMGDPVELQQVFSYLLAAASDRTPGGGTLKLMSANLTGVVEVSIQDASLGLGADGPINPDSKPGEAAGVPLVGMAIAKNIVTRFGGVIRSDDLPGLGTTVTVRFPMVSAKHRARWVVSKAREVRVPALAGRPAVLLADPGETTDQVKKWLEEAGQAVEVRSSGETALAPLATGRPAVFIVDGAMTGSDWMAFLRTASDRRSAPVVLLLRDEGQRALLAGLGAAAPARMVGRPLAAEALLAAVALAELESASVEASG